MPCFMLKFDEKSIWLLFLKCLLICKFHTENIYYHKNLLDELQYESLRKLSELRAKNEIANDMQA